MRKEPQPQTYAFISVGTAACALLPELKNALGELEKLGGGTPIKIHFIAIDTSAVIRDLNGSGIQTLVIGEKKLNGNGSGIDPKAGRQAFLDSKAQFIKLLKKIKPKGVVGIGVPGLGGTCTGALVPTALTLRDELKIPTMVYITQPSEYAFEVGPRQIEYYKEVILDINRNNICTSLLHADWMYSKEEFEDLEISEGRAQVMKKMAQAISQIFAFWQPPKKKINNLSVHDPNDLNNQALLRGGWVKIVGTEVNLAISDQEKMRQELEERFNYLTSHSLFEIGTPITFVTASYRGKWKTTQLKNFRYLIDQYAGGEDREHVYKESFADLSEDSEEAGTGYVTLLFRSPMEQLPNVATPEQVAQPEEASAEPSQKKEAPASQDLPIAAIEYKPPASPKPANGNGNSVLRPMMGFGRQKISLKSDELQLKNELIQSSSVLKNDLANLGLLTVAQAAETRSDPFSIRIFREWVPAQFEPVTKSIRLENGGSDYKLVEERLSLQLWKHLDQRDILEALKENKGRNEAGSWLEFLHLLFKSQNRNFPGEGKLEFKNSSGRTVRVTPELAAEDFYSYLTSFGAKRGSQEHQTADELYRLKKIFGKEFIDLWNPVIEEPKGLLSRMGDKARSAGSLLLPN